MGDAGHPASGTEMAGVATRKETEGALACSTWGNMAILENLDSAKTWPAAGGSGFRGLARGSTRLHGIRAPSATAGAEIGLNPA